MHRTTDTEICRQEQLAKQMIASVAFSSSVLKLHIGEKLPSINGVVVTWVVAIDPPGVRFPLNAGILFVVVLWSWNSSSFAMSNIERVRCGEHRQVVLENPYSCDNSTI
jgi:hypothetical protein